MKNELIKKRSKLQRMPSLVFAGKLLFYPFFCSLDVILERNRQILWNDSIVWLAKRNPLAVSLKARDKALFKKLNLKNISQNFLKIQ